ncbi:elongation factor P 5-aminopentanone reductase [Halobacillus amylolyticus]|uniref:SDR family oxidoreductase n=1 Tax=Halobacillus amylolyticus TaxID=2932259 RepID=A0ABY4HDL9_9BACI|nr:SDR family oxidoreductase [Halobacillus amylolyticus]UOR12661.1 SDR family oxidoreductase [Halobacillus amylolyticus]
MPKRCLIIGASGEIGCKTTELLAAEGYEVAVHYHLNDKAIDELKQRIASEKWLGAYKGDLSTASGLDDLLNKLPAHFDAVVFAQGNHSSKLLQDLTSLEMDEMYYVHVKSLWLITNKLLPSMISNKSGAIVVVSSVWGEEGASTEVVYSSVKGAQISFVKGLAKEAAPSNIRVNAVTPGLIATKMNDHLSSEDMDMLKNEIPLGRPGTCEEVAQAILFLLNKQSGYITGHTLRVNGGWY